MKKLLSLALTLCMLLSLAPAALAAEALPPEDTAVEAPAEAPTEALEPEVPQEEPAEEPAELAELDVPQEEPAEEPAELAEPEVPQDDPADVPVGDDVSPAGTSFASPDVPESEPAEESTEEPDDADEEESVSTEAAEITVAPSDEPPENGWYNDGEHYYYYENRRYISECTHQIDGVWYGFNRYGHMLDDDECGIYNSDGDAVYIRARSGGALYVNEWYSFVSSLSGETVKYYYGEKGYAVKGYQFVDGHYYCFDYYGRLYTGQNIAEVYDDSSNVTSYVVNKQNYAFPLERNSWTEVEGLKYYCINGFALRGQIRRIDGQFYFFTYDGYMLDDASQSFYDNNGPYYYVYVRAHHGGALYADEWYHAVSASGSIIDQYYGPEGKTIPGYQFVDGHYYYFAPDGTPLVNNIVPMKSEDGYSYVCDKQGYATRLNKDGWTQAGDYWYYCINGEALTGHVRPIDGAYYGFNYNGRLIVDKTFESRNPFEDNELEIYHAGPDGKLVSNVWAYYNYAWYYIGPNMKAYRNGTYTIDGKQYSFDEEGRCKRNGAGWLEINGQWHYFNASGYAVSGWQKIGGKWYYFDSSSSAMTVGKREIGGKLYYFDKSGAMQSSKWLQMDGSWLYAKSSGELAVGWAKISNKWYYFDSIGRMVTGKEVIDGKTYRFSDGGVMLASKWLEESDGWHYLNSGGLEVTGWYKVSSKWYYFDGNGVMLTGKQEIGGKLYFFADSGVMQAGKWVQDGADWYYLGSGGDAYRSQWLKSGGKWYYFDENCVMLADTSREIKGKTYHFNASGVCTNP